MKIKTLLIVFLLTIAFTGITNAQDRREEMMKILKQKFMEKVQVDEASADKFFSLFEQNRKEIAELNKRKKDIMKTIEQNVDSPDISSRLDELITIDNDIHNKRVSFYNEIKTFLTPKQIAQSLVLQKNFRKFLRDEMGKRRKKRGDQ